MNEIVNVSVTFGKGVVFVIPLLVKRGMSNEDLTKLAFSHMRANMPSQQDIDSMETFADCGRLAVFIEHEKEVSTP